MGTPISGIQIIRHLLTALSCLSLLASCSKPEQTSELDLTAERWYTQAQVERGAETFATNCATCHGELAQGLVADWRQKLDDDSFPPPPLNGSAHAWHHPRSVLLQVIDNGGAEFGGKMPGFASTLDTQQKLAAIAYIQSLWNDETYAKWLLMGGIN